MAGLPHQDVIILRGIDRPRTANRRNSLEFTDYSLSDIHLFGPLLKNTWQASCFQQKPTWRKLSSPERQKLTPVPFTPLWRAWCYGRKKCLKSLLAHCRSDVYHLLQMLTKQRKLLLISLPVLIKLKFIKLNISAHPQKSQYQAVRYKGKIICVYNYCSFCIICVDITNYIS